MPTCEGLVAIIVVAASIIVAVKCTLRRRKNGVVLRTYRVRGVDGQRNNTEFLIMSNPLIDPVTVVLSPLAQHGQVE